MDKIILGLLILKNRTIYEIRSKLDQGMNMMYSSSLGSIQAAIKKLLSQNFIEFNEVIEGGKYKKQYSITPNGRKEFDSWINTPMKPNQNKNPDLAKLYFMGLSDKKTRQMRIDESILSLQEMYDTLKVIYDDGINMSVPKEHKDLFTFQLLSVKHGLDSIDFEIKWYQKLSSDIKRGMI